MGFTGLRQSLLLKSFFLVLVLHGSLSGQTASKKRDTTPVKPKIKRIQREVIINALFELAKDVKPASDKIFGIQTRLQIGATIWPYYPQRSNELWRECWVEGLHEWRQDNTKEASLKLLTDIIATVSGKNRTLGEEFLQTLETVNQELQANTAQGHNNSVRRELAQRALAQGDAQRALELAGIQLNIVNAQNLIFLSKLRGVDASLADAHYATLLNSAANNPLADANTISILASYLFTPNLIVQCNRQGSHSVGQIGPKLPPPSVEKQLYDVFFIVAAQVLLRPLADNENNTTAGVAGTWFISKRLLPLFQRHAPSLATQIATQINALTPRVEPKMQNLALDYIRSGLSEPTASGGQEISSNNNITPEEVAEKQLDEALALAEQGQAEALSLLEQIEADDLDSARTYIFYLLIKNRIAARKPEEALSFLQESNLTGLVKVWGLSEIALQLKPDSIGTRDIVLAQLRQESSNLSKQSAEALLGLISLTSVESHLFPRQNAGALLSIIWRLNRAKADKLPAPALQVNFAAANKQGFRNDQYSILDFFSLIKRQQEVDATTTFLAIQQLENLKLRSRSLLYFSKLMFSREAAPTTIPATERKIQ
jgi:hypothetical protein